jgi:hypothetical protein
LDLRLKDYLGIALEILKECPRQKRAQQTSQASTRHLGDFPP